MSKQIYVRLGFSDVVITKEENENFNGYADLISEDDDADDPIAQTRGEVIGYELEDGTECDEDGNPMSIRKKLFL